VIYVPDHENVRGCGGIAAISPNLGTSGLWGKGAISILGIEGWVNIALWKEKCALSQESIVGCRTYSLIYTETSKQERQFLC